MHFVAVKVQVSCIFMSVIFSAPDLRSKTRRSIATTFCMVIWSCCSFEPSDCPYLIPKNFDGQNCAKFDQIQCRSNCLGNNCRNGRNVYSWLASLESGDVPYLQMTAAASDMTSSSAWWRHHRSPDRHFRPDNRHCNTQTQKKPYYYALAISARLAGWPSTTTPSNVIWTQPGNWKPTIWTEMWRFSHSRNVDFLSVKFARGK